MSSLSGGGKSMKTREEHRTVREGGRRTVPEIHDAE